MTTTPPLATPPLATPPHATPDATPRRYRCRHVTRYLYGEDVPVSHHMAHLVARSHPLQRCRRAVLTVSPTPAVRSDLIDYFGNPLTYIAVQEPHRELVFTAESEIEVSAAPAFDYEATPPWETLTVGSHDFGGTDQCGEIMQFAFDSVLVQADAELADYAAPSFAAGRPIAAAAMDLTLRIHADFTFDPAATTVSTPLSEVMANRRGVCQDFAHLLIGCLRSLRLPARYVSGYLRTLPPPGKPRLIGADVSHAWGSAYCGAGRWLDLCPTNARAADQDFITVAWGRDFDDVSPLRGVIHGSTGHGLAVEVDVEPLA